MILFQVFVMASATSSAASSSMWREMRAHCSAGLCKPASGSRLTAPATECHGNLLAYQYALSLIPSRAPMREVFDALELATSCGITPPSDAAVPLSIGGAPMNSWTSGKVGPSFWVAADSTGADTNAGTESSPFATIQRALQATRSASESTKSATIVLKKGAVHYLTETIALGAADSGLTITAEPSALVGEVAVSGGIVLPPSIWRRSSRAANASLNLWEAHLPHIAAMPGLTTLGSSSKGHRRVTRARDPNAGPSLGSELCTKCWHNGVKLWHKDLSCVGQATTEYKDLRDCDNTMHLPDGSPCKNDSAMFDTYNTWSNGHGGCCAPWSGDDSPLYGPMGNYFCGNASAGGWVGFNDPRGMPGDANYDGTQGLSPALPVGFDYNTSKYPILASIKEISGAIFHVWRAQGWFVNMFEIASSSSSSNSSSSKDEKVVDETTTTGAINFAKMTSRGVEHVKGGWQGGRGWQINASAINSTEYNYLLAGKWMVENAFELLDEANEWFFDEKKKMLYLVPNATNDDDHLDPLAPSESYVAVQLETLLSIQGTMAKPVRDITIRG